jgi:nitroreductase
MTALTEASLDQLFRTARSYNGWSPEKVSEALLRQIYELAKLGPTSANSCPARFLFITSDDAKARLAPHMSSRNRPKALAAPVNVIIAHDLDYADKLPFLFPHDTSAHLWFSTPEARAENSLRNSSLQGAYLMLAARALGLDCGPMSGFKVDGVNAEFFANSCWRANFICNIGYGSEENLHPRSPRLSFEDACMIV